MKYLLSLLLAIAFLVPSAFALDRLSGSKEATFAYVEDAASATVSLVGATASRYNTLYRMILTSATADNFYLKCGSTQKTAKMYVPANGQLDLQIYPFYLQCGANEALQVVKGTAATAIGVNVWYTKEQ